MSTTGEDGKPVVTDEEVAALVERAGPADASPGEARSYDLAGVQRITRGRMPTLEFLHENFARLYRNSMTNMLKRDLKVTFEGVQPYRAADYLSRLPMPACLDLARSRALPGQLLFSLHPALLYSLVEAYFGGNNSAAKSQGRREGVLTPTEIRFAQVMVRQACTDLGQVWQPVATLDLEVTKHESSAHFIDIAGPGETLYVNRFLVEMPSVTGELDFVIPSASLEPLREVLTSGSGARPVAEGQPWSRAIGHGLNQAQVDVRVVLAEAGISLGELVALKPGDVIPIEAPGDARLMSGEVPLYTGKFGVSRGRNAITIAARQR